MKNLLKLCVPLFALALAAPAAAQQLELPRPSPFAKVSQFVGLTEITVDYSSPAAKGRTIWGGVVPYGKLWRTGANLATKLTFAKDVTIADKAVPAGTYALFTIPGRESWTVILNKNPNQGGTDEYKQDLDLLRFQARSKTVPARERMTFLFNDTTDGGTSIDLEWAGLRLSIPVKTGTDQQVATAIKDLEEGTWRPWNNAARYMMDKKNYDSALQLVDRSLSQKEDWFNLWTKAQILAAQKKTADACAQAQKSQELGSKAKNFFFSDEVKKALADWKCK